MLISAIQYVDKLSDNLLKLQRDADFKKTEQMNYENTPQQI